MGHVCRPRPPHIWPTRSLLLDRRYNAALDKWTAIHTVRVLSNAPGWINSLAAASNVACWVGYYGEGLL